MNTNYPSTISSSPTDSQESFTLEAVKKGHFLVRGNGLTSWLWSKRLITLKNTCLTIHKLQSELKALETIFFEEIRDLERSELKPHCFKVNIGARNIYVACKSEEEMWSWMDSIYKRSPMKGVSNPTNFSHRAHLSFDATTGMLTTINRQWDPLISPTLSKEDYLNNPEIVMEFIQMCTGYARVHEKPKFHSVLLESPTNFDLPEIPKMSVFEDIEFKRT
ncbi:Protein kinase [Basidiobolus ranarum]|uniref:Protein kinase n=1 Tax=Basidiobolus ranarum TaxID=34480 RepID=A0ABR2VZZ8_9FUNG